VTPSDYDRERLEEEERADSGVDETPRDAGDGNLDPEARVEPEGAARGQDEPFEDDDDLLDEDEPLEQDGPPHVSVVSEARRDGGDADEDEFQYHSEAHHAVEGVADAIQFIDVHKAFGRNRVLRGLNLGIPEGQISMILGPSGTGKSVCIKHMVGLLYPDSGDILVHGESVPSMPDDELFEMRKKFGVLFQDGALFGSMNLYDNVAFPLRQHTDKGEDEILEIVSRRLNEVGLGDSGEKMPNELSGGMRKRAGFARALVLDPEIVLFDEPDSGLDPVRTALLCELIKEVHQENGGSYVVITHDIMSARRVAEFIAVLWRGRIVESGPAAELFNSANPFVRQFLTGESDGPLGME
jgi:phospholipid/cholesterol/gamma-HCH transport system ATP-binding protein